MPRDFLGGFNVASNLGFARGVLLLEDCEGAFTWTVTGSGGDDVHAFAAAAAYMGGFGMHLKTMVTGSALYDQVVVSKLMGSPESGLLVVRCRVACVDVTDVGWFELSWEAGDGALGWGAGLRWSPVDGKVYYIDVGGSYVEVAALATFVYDGQFVVIELIVDLKAHKYVSACINGVRSDLGSVAICATGAATARYVSLDLTVSASAAGPGEVYVDCVYVGEYLSA